MIKLQKQHARLLVPVTRGGAWWEEFGATVNKHCAKLLDLGETVRADMLILRALKENGDEELAQALFKLNSDIPKAFVVALHDEVQIIGRSQDEGLEVWAKAFLFNLYVDFGHFLTPLGVPMPVEAWLHKCEVAVDTKEGLELVTQAKAAFND